MAFLRICLFLLLSANLLAVAPPVPVQKTQKKTVATKKGHKQQTAKKRKPVQRRRVTNKQTSTRPKAAPPKKVTVPTKTPPAQSSTPTPTPKAPGITAAQSALTPPPPSVPSVVPQVAPPTIGVPKPSQTTPKATHKEQRLIVLDPGHGGYDLGARMSACDEKSLALSTALLTKKHLTEMGYRVILTRSRDVFMPLEQRTMIANETKGKLFVSIHFNAAKNPIAKGIEVFYYASADKFRAFSSKKLAARVLNKIIDRTVAENRGIKEGNFHVIRETKMPAILIEAGFMTHPDELHLLKDVNYRDKIARGIAEGIDSFFRA
jgi:N-acetylmuramoyl-L-alanine amidase